MQTLVFRNESDNALTIVLINQGSVPLAVKISGDALLNGRRFTVYQTDMNRHHETIMTDFQIGAPLFLSGKGILTLTDRR